MTIFGDKIRKLREEKKMTQQKQVAALFASGTMTNEEKTIFMDEMTRLYLESKKNRRKW